MLNSQLAKINKYDKYIMIIGIIILVLLFIYFVYEYCNRKQIEYFDTSPNIHDTSPNIDDTIPNIIHFVYIYNTEFSYSKYLSILSAYIVNKPEKIYIYYNDEPFGKWWEKLKNRVPVLIVEKVELPTHFGNKAIKHIAHKSDKIRMEKLYERGGIYMDLDTISVRPYKNLLGYDTVLGYEAPPDTICNAVMMTKPGSSFFKIWLELYEKEFKTDGWGEASIVLPGKINNEYPGLAKIMPPETFFRPYATEGNKIFVDDYNIPESLITLHLWETYTNEFLKNMNYDWITKNDKTLYSRIVNKNIDKNDLIN